VSGAEEAGPNRLLFPRADRANPAVARPDRLHGGVATGHVAPIA